jgi:hypothetical protein
MNTYWTLVALKLLILSSTPTGVSYQAPTTDVINVNKTFKECNDQARAFNKITKGRGTVYVCIQGA